MSTRRLVIVASMCAACVGLGYLTIKKMPSPGDGGSTGIVPPNGWYSFRNASHKNGIKLSYYCEFDEKNMKCAGVDPLNNKSINIAADVQSGDESKITYKSICGNCEIPEISSFTFKFSGKSLVSVYGTGIAAGSSNLTKMEIEFIGK